MVEEFYTLSHLCGFLNEDEKKAMEEIKALLKERRDRRGEVTSTPTLSLPSVQARVRQYQRKHKKKVEL